MNRDKEPIKQRFHNKIVANRHINARKSSSAKPSAKLFTCDHAIITAQPALVFGKCQRRNATSDEKSHLSIQNIKGIISFPFRFISTAVSVNRLRGMMRIIIN